MFTLHCLEFYELLVHDGPETYTNSTSGAIQRQHPLCKDYIYIINGKGPEVDLSNLHIKKRSYLLLSNLSLFNSITNASTENLKMCPNGFPCRWHLEQRRSSAGPGGRSVACVADTPSPGTSPQQRDCQHCGPGYLSPWGLHRTLAS